MRRPRWPASATKSDNYSIGRRRTLVLERAFFTEPRYPRLGFDTNSCRPMRPSEPPFPAPRVISVLRAALLVPLLLGACRTVERGAASARPEAERIRRDIAYLADDRLEGRGTGTAGNDSAAAWLARRYESLGPRAIVAESPAAACPVSAPSRTPAAGPVR